MLAAHRAAELDHQVRHLPGDRSERFDAFGGLDVDDRPDMQAADVGVAVARGPDPMPLDNRLEAVVERGKPVRAHGRVLDEGDRLGVAHHGHQQGESGLADLPEIIAGGIVRLLRMPSTPGRPSNRRARSSSRGRARPENRRRTGLPGRQPGGPRRSRGSEKRGFSAARSRIIRSSISTATGPVATISASRSRAAGIVANGKHHQPLGGGDRNHAKIGRRHHRQRPLGADDQLREIELPGLLGPARGTHR